MTRSSLSRDPDGDLAIQEACGIRTADIARVLGITPACIRKWRRDGRVLIGSVPDSHVYKRYLRIMRGLRNHAGVPEEGSKR